METSWCFPWGIIFNHTSNLPTKPLTSQLVELILALLHTRTTEKEGCRAQVWDLHPATLQRACGFKGFQHRLCSITAKTPSLGGFACANLGFAALSFWGLSISDFQWVLYADVSPHTLGIILWVPRFPQQFWEQILRLKCYTCYYWETCSGKNQFLWGDHLLNSGKDKYWLLLQWIAYTGFNSYLIIHFSMWGMMCNKLNDCYQITC